MQGELQGKAYICGMTGRLSVEMVCENTWGHGEEATSGNSKRCHKSGRGEVSGRRQTGG